LIIRRVLLFTIGIEAIVLVIVLLRYQGDFPVGLLTLNYIDASNASINRPIADFANPQESLGLNDSYTLNFSGGTTMEVSPGTQLSIEHFGQELDSVQVLITLRQGQIICHVGAQSNGRAYFRVMMPHGATIDARQSDFIAVVNDTELLIGAQRGTPLITLNGKTISLSHGNGLTLITNGPTAIPSPNPQPWATVRMPLFAPSGTALSLPLTLSRLDNQNTGGAASFYMKSGGTLLIPDGVYTPTVRTNAPSPYVLPSITVPAGQLSEWPSTLSELQFGVIDSSSKPVSAIKLLNLNADSTTTVIPDTLLIPPNKPVNFTLARIDAPDQSQPSGDLLTEPGQRLQVPLRNDLFGGGSLQVSMTNPDGTKRTTGNVVVYTPGTEDNPNTTPLQRFKTDETQVFLGHGDYVVLVSIPNSVTRRYPLTIMANKVTPLVIKLGTLTVIYNDNNSHPVSAWLYVGSDADLKRLGQTVDQARQLVYGFTLRTGMTLTVPIGDYAFRIDALHAPPTQTVTVAPGQNPPITVNAQNPSP